MSQTSIKRVTSVKRRPRIVIAGGGFAALESMLALRAMLCYSAEITIVAPSRRFAYRPAAAAEAFGSAPPRGYDLSTIASEHRVRFRMDRLEAVASQHRSVRLASFATLPYDVLVLALGARARVAIPGALTFKDQAEVPKLRKLLAEVRGGIAKRVLFALPRGCCSPLPLYELALAIASDPQARRAGADVAVVSPSRAPLQQLGEEASAAASKLLEDAGVQFIGGAAPSAVRRDGGLSLRSGVTIAADRVVAAPRLLGPRVGGIPSDADRFVEVDRDGAVRGLEGVYAAGDMTTFPLKHPTLAAEQADLIARSIAERLGGRVDATLGEPSARAALSKRSMRVMNAALLALGKPVAVRAAFDALGAPLPLRGEPAARTRSQQRAYGLYLGACLASRQPLRA